LGFLVLKTNHLATLLGGRAQSVERIASDSNESAAKRLSSQLKSRAKTWPSVGGLFFAFGKKLRKTRFIKSFFCMFKNQKDQNESIVNRVQIQLEKSERGFFSKTAQKVLKHVIHFLWAFRKKCKTKHLSRSYFHMFKNEKNKNDSELNRQGSNPAAIGEIGERLFSKTAQVRKQGDQGPML
jgi:hypothetical protein